MALTTFSRIHTANRGYSTYKAQGFPGVILLAKPAFNGEHPETLEVADVPAAVEGSRTARAKMTPEERKAKAAEERARLAGLTPKQRMEEKAAKLRAKLAEAEAKAAKVVDKPAEGDAASA